MRKIVIIAYALGALCICVLAAHMPAAHAQTVAPGDAVSGTVIIDGNDFMQAQHMSNLISSGEQLQQQGFQSLRQTGAARYQVMGGAAASGGAPGRAPAGPRADPAALARKEHELDDFTPSVSSVPHDLAAKLAAGDQAKSARLEKLFDELLTRYHAVAKEKHIALGTVSASYMTLVQTAYAAQGKLSSPPDSKTLLQLSGALGNYVSALQLVSGHAQSDVEKQRAYDTIAISTMVLATEYDLAAKRSDARLTAKVQGQARGTMMRMFGCSTDSTPLADCIQHIGLGSAKIVSDGGYALLKL